MQSSKDPDLLEANRALAREGADADVIREPLRVATALSGAISSASSLYSRTCPQDHISAPEMFWHSQ